MDNINKYVREKCWGFSDDQFQIFDESSVMSVEVNEISFLGKMARCRYTVSNEVVESKCNDEIRQIWSKYANKLEHQVNMLESCEGESWVFAHLIQLTFLKFLQIFTVASSSKIFSIHFIVTSKTRSGNEATWQSSTWFLRLFATNAFFQLLKNHFQLHHTRQSYRKISRKRGSKSIVSMKLPTNTFSNRLMRKLRQFGENIHRHSATKLSN